jgi:hypothetical protein
MLSRLLAPRSSSLLTRAVVPSTRALVALPSKFSRDEKFQFSRSFNSSTVLQNATAGSLKQEDDSVIAKYGTIPFFGMLATILVSKEIYIIDAEWLLSMEIVLFVTAGYVMTGDTIDKYCQAEDEKKLNTFNDQNDLMLAICDQYKRENMVAQDKPDVMRQYLAEHEESVKQFAAYEAAVPRHAARAKLLQTLEQIHQKEKSAADEEWKKAIEDAVTNVRAAFEDGADRVKLSDEAFTLAIKCMGEHPDTTPEEDPVKRLFMKQFPEDA